MSAATQQTGPGIGQMAFALGVLGVLAILIVPLPAWMMDLAVATNLALSIVVILHAMGLLEALEFSSFPSVLLLLTLFRLGLNVATTRLVLSDGAHGTAAAGHIIETFGRFVIGGKAEVGIVIFLILLVVNFTVITKGSGRISEVAARFTLDALPGKQMSIDADLAAGVIDDKEARRRRDRLQQESEFFGAMDGASKFVSGDAVAALIITAINIVGGLAVGMIRDHLSIGQAVDTYTILTVGDGLVSQIPALLISTAAGIMVTRAAGDNLASQVGGQLFANEQVLRSTAAVMGFMSLLPGLPFLPFAALSGGSFMLSRRMRRSASAGLGLPTKASGGAAGLAGSEADKPAERLQDLLALDALELSVGYALLPLIDLARNGELPGRVTALRKQLAADLGIVLPSVHLRDNLQIQANEYEIRLRGHRIGSGVAYPERLMALDQNGQSPRIDGIPAKEPAFGLPAVWVLPKDRSTAEARGLTIVDAASMMTTHLSELLRQYAHELVGRQEVQELLSVVSKDAPKLVEDTVPGQVGLGELVRIVRGLLREGLSVRDLRTVLEAVGDAAPRSKDVPFLIEQVRRRLTRQITGRFADPQGVVHAVNLDHPTEDLMRQALGNHDGEVVLNLDLDLARRLIQEVEAKVSLLSAAGHPGVIMAPPELRRPLFDFLSRFVGEVAVISARELVTGTTVVPAGTIQLAPVPPSGAPRARAAA